MVYKYRRSTRSYRGRRGGRRRSSVWVRQLAETAGAVPVGQSAGVNLLPDTSLDPGARIGSTVVRIRGNFWIAYPPNWSWDSKIVAGIAVTEKEADYSNTIVNPMVDYNSVHWMYWDTLHPGGSGYPVVIPSTVGVLTCHSFDVKAQRVISVPDLTVNWYWYPPTPGIAPSNYGISAQVLVKLS